MYTKAQNIELELIYPYLLSAKATKRKLVDQTSLLSPEKWQSNCRNCLMVGFHTDRETKAEMKILKLLMHNSRQRLQLVPNAIIQQKVPTDAEIVFGNCKCEKVFCTNCGWEQSRLHWLWELEQRQQQALEEQLTSSNVAKSSTDKNPTMPSIKESRKPGCWDWLLQSCGYNLETDSSSNLSTSSLSV